MGLAAVQGIVNKHRVSINVKSQPGECSAFTILLPGIKEDDKKNGSDANISSDEKSLLFIYDEERITKIATRMLESLAFSVFSEQILKKRLNCRKWTLMVIIFLLPMWLCHR